MASVVSRSCLVLSLVGGLAATATAQTPLPMGAPQQGKVASGGTTEYTVVAKTAGVLVAAVKGDADLVLQVTDSDGQTVPEGSSDKDMNGNEGTELVSTVIPEPGTYKVRVRVNGGGAATFDISGSWMGFPPFAMASSDPDRRPSTAKSAQVGKALEDQLDSKTGDSWDWYVMKSAQAGTLVIVTRRVGEGDTDLVLEAYLDGNFAQPAQRSDQDLQGNNASESVTLQVNAGQVVHVKVSANFSNASTKYRLSSNLVP
jgi:hypothetical protein